MRAIGAILEGKIQDRGVVARLIDQGGNHVASLLVVEPVNMVVQYLAQRPIGR